MINRIVVFLPNKISLKDPFDGLFDLTVWHNLYVPFRNLLEFSNILQMFLLL